MDRSCAMGLGVLLAGSLFGPDPGQRAITLAERSAAVCSIIEGMCLGGAVFLFGLWLVVPAPLRSRRSAYLLLPASVLLLVCLVLLPVWSDLGAFAGWAQRASLAELLVFGVLILVVAGIGLFVLAAIFWPHAARAESNIDEQPSNSRVFGSLLIVWMGAAICGWTYAWSLNDERLHAYYDRVSKYVQEGRAFLLTAPLVPEALIALMILAMILWMLRLAAPRR